MFDQGIQVLVKTGYHYHQLSCLTSLGKGIPLECISKWGNNVFGLECCCALVCDCWLDCIYFRNVLNKLNLPIFSTLVIKSIYSSESDL